MKTFQISLTGGTGASYQISETFSIYSYGKKIHIRVVFASEDGVAFFADKKRHFVSTKQFVEAYWKYAIPQQEDEQQPVLTTNELPTQMRLVKAANVFNIGTSKIVKFLGCYGIIIENKPTVPLGQKELTLLLHYDTLSPSLNGELSAVSA